MRLTNRLSLPQPIVDAVANDEYSRGDADISVTQLIDPPRKVELLRRHDDELEEDVSDRIFSLFGQAIHVILERANRTGDVENRLYMQVGGWTISGQYDRIALVEDDSGKVVLSDYKTAKVYEITNGVKPERELQLNVLAYLARLHGHRIDKLEAIFILRDWSKVRASKVGGPPIVIVQIPLWSEEKALAYITERVALHRGVREGTIPLPECSAEDRWADKDKWAVKKPGRKSAVRVLDWEAEAAVFISSKDLKNHYIERRPSESLRCQFYCSAAPVCSQWASIREAQGEDEVE